MLRRRGAHAPRVAVSRVKKVVVSVLAAAFLAAGAGISLALSGRGRGSNAGCPGHQPPPHRVLVAATSSAGLTEEGSPCPNGHGGPTRTGLIPP